MENLREQARNILDKTLQEYGAAGVLGKGGAIYQGAVRAVEIALSSNVNVKIEGTLDFSGIDRDTLNLARKSTLAELQEIETNNLDTKEIKSSQEISKESELRREKLVKGIQAVKSNIDFTKRGAIVEAFFYFSDFMRLSGMGGATWTELNKMYHVLHGGKLEDYENNPTICRGGSINHMLATLRFPARRMYSKLEKYISTENGFYIPVVNYSK